jgi:hypothetical protein
MAPDVTMVQQEHHNRPPQHRRMMGLSLSYDSCPDSPLLLAPAGPAVCTPQLMVASSRPSMVEPSVVLLL